MRVEYIGAAWDGSGYGAACRNYLVALNRAGVDVSLTPISFEEKKPDLGELGKVLRLLVRDGATADIRVIHATPENYARLLYDKPGIPTIGYATWEANRLPEGWAAEINEWCDALWVPSNHNVECFQASGVTIPVYRVPHCFEPAEPQGGEGSRLETTDRFRFLWIGQWLTRKNPEGLLRAYLSEFREHEKVSLVMKTYLTDNSRGERDQIKEFVTTVKKQLYMPDYPQIELVVSSLSNDGIAWLHHDCDCYVSLHRCEGFGMTVAEAMAAGKPVIVTDRGGGTDDFVREDLDGFRVQSQQSMCFGMPWPTYHGGMTWAEPDLIRARRAMRLMFNTPTGRAEMGEFAKRQIHDEFSYEKVGRMMVGLLRNMVR